MNITPNSGQARKEAGIWTVPNVLTVARILSTPLFVVSFLDQQYRLALAVFILAGLSDALDGFLAKVLNQRSKLGAMLDPLADKTLLDSCYICLAWSGWIPVWLTVTVVSRDVIILGGLALLAFWGRDMRERIAPSLISKMTTTVQMLLVPVAFLCFLGLVNIRLEEAMGVLTVVAASLTVISGAHYVWLGFSLFAASNGEENSAPRDRP